MAAAARSGCSAAGQDVLEIRDQPLVSTLGHQADGVHAERELHSRVSTFACRHPPASRRDTKLFPEAEEAEGVLMLRVSSGIFFANAVPIRAWVMREVRCACCGCAVPTWQLLWPADAVPDAAALAVQ